MARGHRYAFVQLKSRDSVALAVDARHLGFLTHLTTELTGMIKQDLIVDRAINLKGGAMPLTLKLAGPGFILEVAQGEEFEVPEFRRLAPAKGGADLDGKIRRLDLVP